MLAEGSHLGSNLVLLSRRPCMHAEANCRQECCQLICSEGCDLLMLRLNRRRLDLPELRLQFVH